MQDEFTTNKLLLLKYSKIIKNSQGGLLISLNGLLRELDILNVKSDTLLSIYSDLLYIVFKDYNYLGVVFLILYV